MYFHRGAKLLKLNFIIRKILSDFQIRWAKLSSPLFNMPGGALLLMKPLAGITSKTSLDMLATLYAFYETSCASIVQKLNMKE